MYSVQDVIKRLKMTEFSLFGMKSRCNNVYSLLQVFQTLLLYPCFMIRNPYHLLYPSKSCNSRALQQSTPSNVAEASSNCSKSAFISAVFILYFSFYSLLDFLFSDLSLSIFNKRSNSTSE